jgi:hypothetical protein
MPAGILEYVFAAIAVFFLAALAFGPHLTGLTDKRNKHKGEKHARKN